MIITAEEYFSKLHLTLNENPPAYARLPSANNICPIDIESRTIQPPKELGVERDHKSKTIYFSVNQRVDYMDLSQTCCNIHYKNLTTGLTGIYIVPFYDVFTLAEEGKMLIPWNLDATVLSAAGVVQFSFHFYKLGEKSSNISENKEKIIAYLLNTQTASSKVLKGMEVVTNSDNSMNTNNLIQPSQFAILNSRIDEVAQYNQLYWTIL